MIHTFTKPLLTALTTAALFFGMASAQDNTVSSNTAAKNAITVMVQPGDTAYSLARRAGLDLPSFLSLNNLPNTSIKVGQVLIVHQTAPYTVQPGETLYSIARKYNVKVDAIAAFNNLPEDGSIDAGQLLHIPSAAQVASTLPTQAAPTPTVTPSVSSALSALSGNWRENAQALMGVPYVWGGTSRTGTDCSGFVLQVFTPLGVKLPRVSADQARAGIAVDINNLQPGDLVFFDTVGSGKVTHVGIYLGNDTFMNANSYRGQVTIDRLKSDKYWMPRYLSARRVLPDNIMASQ